MIRKDNVTVIYGSMTKAMTIKARCEKCLFRSNMKNDYCLIYEKQCEQVSKCKLRREIGGNDNLK